MPENVPTGLDGRRLPEAAQRALRERAIAAYKQGMKRGDITRALGMSRQWVWKVLRSFDKHGERAAVIGHRRGPKSETVGKMKVLTSQEERQLQAWIVDKNPKQMKFEWALWTRRAVQELVKAQFGKDIAIRTVGEYFKRWGMTPQRPKKKALQQDPEKVAAWLEQVYPAISKRAKEEGATIFWQDETAVKQDSNWVRGYAPKGQTPILLEDTRGKYGAPVMVSAINNQGKCFFLFQRKAVTSYDFIRFLHRLIADTRAAGRKLFVICDNAKIHHSRLVQAWTKKHESEIELFFLPAYSPTLNPDEYLNRHLKTELRLRPSGTHEKNLERAREFMNKCRQDPEKITRCFEPEEVRYARHCAKDLPKAS